MQRGNDNSGGLGPQLIGEKITIDRRIVSVIRQLGEGGFSFVYLVKDMSEDHESSNNHNHNNHHNHNHNQYHNYQQQTHIVLKITSIHSRQQRDIAEKEAKLLSRLSHPSIVRMINCCYRSYNISSGGGSSNVCYTYDHTSGCGSGGNGNNSNIGNGNGNGNGEYSHNNNDGNDNGNTNHNGNNNNNSNNTNMNNSINNSISINGGGSGNNIRHQHLILMEYCEGGTALSVCNNLKSNNKRFDLHSLIIAFGQICNAVSYLHAQRPPIVHRDLKPVNFLVKNGAYKLCDFGSAVFGHVDLRTSRARTEAEEVIQKTTTQMFRSPEMVDLYMSKKLTESTDVWALGCCLYSLAFLQNCFEEGSNLAILSRKFRIPEDNPYGDDLVELIDRMLTVNCKERADMTEVILCLSSIYSGRPLPPRKRGSKSDKSGNQRDKKEKKERVGTYRTDGQGIRKSTSEEKRPAEAKKLNPNSAAARRRKAAEEGGGTGTSAILLTRQSSKLRKPKSNKQTFHQPFNGDTSSFTRGGSAFAEVDDPFQIGEERPQNPLSFFGSKDSGTDSSQDWGGDFSSENGSGFDNFGSSDDGSRNMSFGKSAAAFLKTLSTPRDISSSVPPFEPDNLGNLNFTNFGVSENNGEEGFEATYNSGLNSDATTSILADINEVGISKSKGTDRPKKKGLKGFFGKGQKIKYDV